MGRVVLAKRIQARHDEPFRPKPTLSSSKAERRAPYARGKRHEAAVLWWGRTPSIAARDGPDRSNERSKASNEHLFADFFLIIKYQQVQTVQTPSTRPILKPINKGLVL